MTRCYPEPAHDPVVGIWRGLGIENSDGRSIYFNAHRFAQRSEPAKQEKIF